MKTKLVLGAVAAAVAVFTQGAFAQSASSPTRAEVKSEAAKSRTPAGEAGDLKGTQPMKGSTANKSDVKAEARKSHTPTGEAGDLKGTQPTKGTETTKEARKAQTQADRKAGKLQPAGEAAMPAADPPKK